MAKKTATKKAMPEEPRTDGYFKAVPRVSKRNFEIYVLCECEGLRQKDVAAKYRITQPRVSAIVHRVAQYLSSNCPGGFFELPREKRLVTLFRTHKMRLQHVYKESMAAWEKSKEGQHRVKLKPVKLEGKDGKTEIKEEVVERIVTNRHGDQRHLQNAVKYADRLMEFEGFDRRGHVDTTVAGRVFEAPDVTEVQAFRLIKERVYKGWYDTEGDKGPPEWFLQQLAAKKPANTYKPYVPEVIFPTTNVIKAPNSVITPSTGVINNGTAVINNSNITPEKRRDYSQAVTQQSVASSATAEKVLYATITPGLAVGDQDLAPAQTPLASSLQAHSPEPTGSGYAVLPEPHPDSLAHITGCVWQ